MRPSDLRAAKSAMLARRKFIGTVADTFQHYLEARDLWPVLRVILLSPYAGVGRPVFTSLGYQG